MGSEGSVGCPRLRPTRYYYWSRAVYGSIKFGTSYRCLNFEMRNGVFLLFKRFFRIGQPYQLDIEIGMLSGPGRPEIADPEVQTKHATEINAR